MGDEPGDELQKMKDKVRGEAERDVDLAALKVRLTGTEYRRLVEKYLRKMGDRLDAAMLGRTLVFNEHERAVADNMVDLYNAMAGEKIFWGRDSGEVLVEMCDIFARMMENAQLEAPDWLKYEMFQAITTNFACMVNEKPDLRKFAGIPKGR